MRLIGLIGAVVGLAAALACGQDARAVLLAASEAMKTNPGGQASFELVPKADSDMFLQTLPSGSGSMFWRRDDTLDEGGAAGHALRLRGSGKLVSKGDVQPINAVVRADRFSVIDDEQRQFVERGLEARPHPAVRLVRMMVLDWFVEVEPYGRALGEAELTLEEGEKVDGQSCDVVTARFPKPAQGSVRKGRLNHDTTRFYFAKSDRLPRRAVLTIETGLGNLVRVIDFRSVQAGAAVSAADVTISPPEGYRVDSAWLKGTGRGGDEEPARAVNPAEVKPAGPVRARAPVYEMESSDGRVINAESQGGRVTVLYFWGSWSLGCREMTGLVGAVGEGYLGKGVDVIAVAIRERDPARVGATMGGRRGLAAVPKGDATADRFDIAVVPSFVVLDGDGRVVATVAAGDGRTDEELIEAVKTAVGEALGETD